MKRVRLVGWRVPGVLEHAGLDRPTEEVLVERERRGRGRLDGDALGDRVLDLLVAGPDPVAERCDHLDARVEGLERELEAELVVPFPVQPWTTASAPSSTAISAVAPAITGRESDETSGYLPS